MAFGVNSTISVSNNQIYVQRCEESAAPVIHVPFNEAVSILVDGVRVIGRTTLTGMERIQVLRERRSPQIRVKTRVCHQAMAVAMTIESSRGYRYELVNSLPQEELYLAFSCKVLEPQMYTPEELCAILARRGFRGEVDHQAIEELCSASETIERVVLRATVSTSSSAVFDRMVFVKEHSHIEKANDVVIGVGVMLIDHVQEVLNEPWTNVYGEEVYRDDLGLRMLLGGGVEFRDGALYSVRKGRLVVTEHFIDVVSQWIITKNVTPPAGDILYPGDVVIQGSVTAGCHIEAAGKIFIDGSVKDSVLKADQGVVIADDVVASSILAGPLFTLYEEAQMLSQDILASFRQLQSNYHRVFLDEPADDPFLQDILLRACHASLLADLQRFVALQDTELKSKKLFFELIHFVETTWLGAIEMSAQKIDETIKRFYAIQLKLMIWREAEAAPIYANSCTASVLRASGGITLNGGDAVASSLESRDRIAIRGAVRGGFVIARYRVYAAETGIASGIETSIRVTDPDGSVFVRLRHPSTLIEVGRYRTYNVQSERNVRVYQHNQEDQRVIGG